MALSLTAFANGAWAAADISVMYGNKFLDNSDWSPNESHQEFGLGFQYQRPQWPIALVVSYSTSDDSFINDTGPAPGDSAPDFGYNIERTGKTTELNLGVRSYLLDNRTGFFWEGGLAAVAVEQHIDEFKLVHVTDKEHLRLPWSSDSASDSAMGWWLGAGMDIKLTNALSVGFLGRVSNADVTLFGEDSTGGGTHIHIFAAYRFGD